MIYQLTDFKISSLSLDDDKKEVAILVDITVGVSGADDRIRYTNSSVPLVLKGFTGYDDLSAKIKQLSSEWVSVNYPNT